MKYRQGTFYKQNKVIYETRASKGIRFIRESKKEHKMKVKIFYKP
jgi:hypothetical protein